MSDGYTFKEMWDDWYQYEEKLVLQGVGKKAPATLKHYQNDYVEFFKNTEIENMRMDNITPKHLEYILTRIFEGKNERRVKNVICNLRYMFVYANGTGKTDRDVFEYIDRQSLLKSTKPWIKEEGANLLTIDQCKAYIDYLHSREFNTPTYVPTYAIEVAILMNLKLGEVAALKWSDINGDYLSIHSMEQRDDFIGAKIITSKSSSRRSKIIPQRVKDIFGKMKQYGLSCDDYPYIFCYHDGKRYDESAIGNAVRRFGKKVLGDNNVSISRLQKSIKENII